jgi:hypothetical protein
MKHMPTMLKVSTALALAMIAAIIVEKLRARKGRRVRITIKIDD